MEPYLALMRRYCIDYTTVHEVGVCDDIMRPDYTVRVSGRTLEMGDYRTAVAGAFRRFPTLSLTVHEMLRSGPRLAMRFSEHGASPGHGGAVAVWQGISLYDWDGAQLRSCLVEQDFLGRSRQLATGRPDQLEQAHPDPWATTTDESGDLDAEATVRAWLAAWGSAADSSHVEAPGFRLVLDDSPHVGPTAPLLVPRELTVNDLFSAGTRVAAHITLAGTYAGGLPGIASDRIGELGIMDATLIAETAPGSVVRLHLVQDRWGLQQRLR